MLLARSKLSGAAGALAALGDHVGGIFGFSSQSQMFNVAAMANVAFMQYAQAIGNRSVDKFPSNPMGANVVFTFHFH